MPLYKYPQQSYSSANPFANAGTYIIDGEVVINQNFTIHSDVTLIFIGDGKISSQNVRTIVGDRTRLIAPISQIFSGTIKVEGNWAIDKSYPQWFSNERYDYDFTESNSLASSIDWAPSINKAINMKKTGEVFLARGRYFIKTPIELRFAINLIGERGRSSEERPTADIANTNGTIIEATSANFSGNCLIQVNKNNDDTNNDWQVPYPASITRITNLTLWNNLSYHKNGLFGIISYGSCIVDSCQFDNLCCGIKFLNQFYSDRKQIYNSSFTFNRVTAEDVLGDKTYAIDCPCLGDGVLLRNNHVLNSKFVGALRLTSCGGGVISSNVFNSDVLLESCKGIVYEANHMEDGAQLMIWKSNAIVRSNFIEKRENPSVVVYSEQGHNCIVNLENNQFICYEYFPRESNETQVNGRNRIRQQCAYDIAVDENSSISIKNQLRFPLVKNLGYYGMFAMGIQIAKYPAVNDSWQPLADFNNISYKLSKESLIDNYRVRYPNLLSVGTISKPGIHANGPNANGQWLYDSGYYEYSISYTNDSGTTITETTSRVQLIYNDGTPSKVNNVNRCGYLFSVGNTVRETTVSITRHRFTSSTQSTPTQVHTVLLHICGASVLYDNGITINGYRWI